MNISKKILVVLLFMLSFSPCFAKVTDTISHWHVQFNQSTILQLNPVMETFVLKINLDTLKESDKLGIRYSPGCAFCNSCNTYLGMYTNENKLLVYKTAIGHWTTIELNFKEILSEHRRHGTTIFDCYFLTGNKIDPKNVVHILKIQLV